MKPSGRHVHQCVCGELFLCDRDPDRCGTDICEQCEADLYWDARAPEDVAEEEAEMRAAARQTADPAARELF